MSMFISIMVVLSTWFLFQAFFVGVRKQRRKHFSKTVTGTIREVVDDVPMIVTSTHRHLNLAPNQPMHTSARLVITEQWMVLASDKGVLLREERGGTLKVKALGQGKWMLLGRTPNRESELRIIIVPTGDQSWIEALRQFCTH